MKNEDYTQLYKDLARFREKEVREGLSYEENQKLAQVISELNAEMKRRYKSTVDVHEKQMFDDVKVVAIRNFSFMEKAMEQTFWEKITKKEPILYYELVTENPEEDIQYDHYTYEFALDVRDFLKEVGLGMNWIEIVPPTMDMSYEFKLAKEEMDWIKELPDPKWCLRKLTEVVRLEEKASQLHEDMHEAIIWLQERWQEGYKIYIDYTELGWL